MLPYKACVQHMLLILLCLTSFTDNVRFSDNGPVSYEVPLPLENTTVSYVDFLYNGSESSGGMLTGGVGQLVDGVKGTAALDTEEGRFPWVGWATPPQQIIFEFGSLQLFGSVTVHAYMNSSEVTWFGSVEVSISQNKGQWNTFSFDTDDRVGPQDITIQTQMDSGIAVEGRYVRLMFGNIQGSGPMLISEVSFNSTVGEFVCNSLCYNIRILNLLHNLNHCPLAPSLCFSTSKYFSTSICSRNH